MEQQIPASDKHHLILDIGYGKSRISLIKDSKVIKTKSWTDTAAKDWVSAIRKYIESHHGVLCGDRSALKALIETASATVDIAVQHK